MQQVVEQILVHATCYKLVWHRLSRNAYPQWQCFILDCNKNKNTHNLTMSHLKWVAPLSLLTGASFIFIIHYLRNIGNRSEISLMAIMSQENLHKSNNTISHILHKRILFEKGPVINTLDGNKFRDVVCKEDLQHIREIENTNIDMTSSEQLTEIFFRSVTRHAITSCVLFLSWQYCAISHLSPTWPSR